VAIQRCIQLMALPSSETSDYFVQYIGPGHSHWGAARDSATTSFPPSVAATNTAPKVSQRRMDASPAATAAAAEPVRCLDVRAMAGSGGPHGAPSCTAAHRRSGLRGSVSTTEAVAAPRPVCRSAAAPGA
jgi:hypothetical protein